MSDAQLKKYVTELEQKIRERFSKDACHDIYHLQRTYNLALHIQKKEGGDRLIVGVAAFLHDMHRVIQTETKKYCEPKDSLDEIKKILDSVNFPKNKYEKILHAIAHHEEYSFTKGGKTVKDIESLIVQDADNLDAMGAIGIGRCFSYCGHNQIPLWAPELKIKGTWYDDSKNDVSAIHHFYDKLFKLKDNMNTKTAKIMAKKRHEYMVIFVERFKNEWKGKI